MRNTSLAGILILLSISVELNAQWTSNRGQGWLDLSTYHHDTKTQFWFDGSEIDLFEEGHIVTSASFLTAVYGLRDGLDVWLQLPFIRSQFDDIAGKRLSQGLGDPRIYARVGPELIGVKTFPIALRIGLKAPLGSFEKDAEILALGDGQLDLEAVTELGYSTEDGKYYSMLWLGYRWRFENSESLFTPGNEMTGLLKLGASHGRFSLDSSLEILRGAIPRSQGLLLSNSRRRMFSITPSIGYSFDTAQFKIGLRFPISGQNLASGTSLMAGLFLPFTL